MADTLTIKLDPSIAAQLTARARDEGISPEQYAAELVAEGVAAGDFPPLTISDEELRISIEEQRRQIAAGTAMLYSHEEVMAAARARLNKALAAKP